jgi:hypothetical protein
MSVLYNDMQRWRENKVEWWLTSHAFIIAELEKLIDFYNHFFAVNKEYKKVKNLDKATENSTRDEQDNTIIK